MIRQLAHLNFLTNNLPGIIDFYVDRLGMKIQFTLNNSQGTPFGYYFGCGNKTFLEFFEQHLAQEEWGGMLDALTAGTRYGHFCLEVTGLTEFVEELRRKEVEVTEITVGMDNSHQAWITDPDGNRIELMEYTSASLQLSGQRT